MNRMEMFSEEKGLLRFSNCWRESSNEKKNLIPIRGPISNITYEGDILDVGHKYYNKIPKKIRDVIPLQNQSQEQLCKYKGKMISKWFNTELKVVTFEEATKSYFGRGRDEARDQAKARAKERRKKMKQVARILSGNASTAKQKQ